MAIITTAEAKLHLKVDQADEDSLIDLYIASAEAYIEKYINRVIPNKNLPTPNVPAPIKAAALLIVGDLYENRQGAGTAEIKENPAVGRLLHPYRVNIGI